MRDEEQFENSGARAAVMREPRFRQRRRPRFVRLDESGPPAPRDSDAAGPAVPIRSVSRVEETILRIMNAVVAIGALLILSPLILLIAILVKLDSPGPVLYRQTRVGLDRRDPGFSIEKGGRRSADIGGQPFEIVKFRTMRVDAEKDSGPVWAGTGDPRVTRIGAVLRRTRLDEIPQFVNVLRGEMSIVGPRPERPEFVGELRTSIENYPLRQQVPPGITGWAQVHRPGDQSLDDVREKIEFDLEYLQRRSLWFDLWIMLKTLPVVFERDHPAKPE